MAKRRKPISFDTTLRNPERIPAFVSIFRKFESEIVDDEIALKIEAEIIRQKIYIPTAATLGEYYKSNDKLDFVADDQSLEAPEKVKKLYSLYEKGEPGELTNEQVVYLLKNTVTSHKEKGWKAGWESRLATQVKFINELGFVYIEKGERLIITDNGRLISQDYSGGYLINDKENSVSVQSAYLNAFAKYQINNPFRQNTIEVNFFPLVLNVINYLKNKYDKKGISISDLPFIITWGSDDYVGLAEYIYKFRAEFGYNVSSQIIYEYAMNLLDESNEKIEFKPASDDFLKSKVKDYKYEKIISETPDEVVRKLRLTFLVTLRGNGRFIDLNTNEMDKIRHIISTYIVNKDFNDDVVKYYEYMGKVDNKLLFIEETEDSQFNIDVKNKQIEEFAKSLNWEELKEEMLISTNKKNTTNELLKYINKPVRLEFLVAVLMKKALPNLKINANYKADDNGIPFNTASGATSKSIGADIDVYEENIHAIVEPTISRQRSFQVEHEMTSIRQHLIETQKSDMEQNRIYKEWFAIFVGPNISREVGNSAAAFEYLHYIYIYPWEIEDFVDYSKSVQSLKDYRIIRPYVTPERMAT